MLPSFAVLAVLLVAASGFLTGLSTYSLHLSVLRIPIGVSVALTSALLMNSLLRLFDKESASSIRRIFGLVLISTVIWTAPIGIEMLLRFIEFGFVHASGTIVFGGFLVWSFELLVVNGAFQTNTLKSLLVAGVYPVTLSTTLLLDTVAIDAYPILTGSLLLVITVIFLLGLNRLRTGRGVTSLSLLNAFVKTWVVQKPASLERFFALYSEQQLVVTDTFVSQVDGKDIALVLPGIHPGPFHPVGSYNISELICEKLSQEGVTALVLHGTGGHERNAPTNTLAVGYAEEVARLVASGAGDEIKTMRGPSHNRMGDTNIATLVLGNYVLSLVSNAPYESDDLDPAWVSELHSAANDLGLNVSLVDAHNSIGGDPAQQVTASKNDWKDILDEALALPDSQFEIGYAHSSEVGFIHGPDISDGGLGLLLLTCNNSRFALVIADSNNAASGLRQRIAAALEHDGLELIELCTSDTHKLAARRLVKRGYYALGEATNQEDILTTIHLLVTIALKRSKSGKIKANRFRMTLPLIGDEPLDDFAKLTDRAVSFTKKSSKLLTPIVILMLLISIFY